MIEGSAGVTAAFQSAMPGEGVGGRERERRERGREREGGRRQMCMYVLHVPMGGERGGGRPYCADLHEYGKCCSGNAA